MTIDKFDLKRFQEALPAGFVDLGLVDGQRVFAFALKKAKIKVYSSIDYTGYARDASDDSIRIILLDEYDHPVMPKLRDWINRVPGWEVRVNDMIQNLYGIYTQLGFCKECGRLMRINQVGKPGPNFGKFFASCGTYSHKGGFRWIDMESREELPVPENVKVMQAAASSPAELIDYAYSTKLDFSKLNADQLAVVNSMGKGSCVVDAAAGSGKTLTSVYMLANMLINGKVNPSRILFVTFGVKAAGEDRVRLAKLLWPNISADELKFYEDPKRDMTQTEEDKMMNSVMLEDAPSFDRDWIDADPVRKFLVDQVCTIHAMSLRLLKRAGMNVKVISGRWQYEADAIIKDSLDEFKWKESPKSIKAYISNAILNLVDPKDARDYYSSIITASDVPFNAPDMLAEIYTRYIGFMRSNGLVDFSMMQADLLKLLRNNPAFRELLQSQFDYIIVDEGQDTDWIQTEIIWTIAAKCGNVFYIGDVFQSLYRFRAAVPEIMQQEFRKSWEPRGKYSRFVLPINYRSSRSVVDQSYKLISQNYIGKEEYLKPTRARDDAPDGEPLQYFEFPTFSDLAEGVVEKIVEQGNPGDWYVLSRTRAECSALHIYFIKRGIPAVNLSGPLLFGSQYIRKVLAYARLACNYKNARDDKEILKEIANVASNKFVAPMTRRRHVDGCNNKASWVDCGCPTICEDGKSMSAVRYYGAEAIEEARNWSGIINQCEETNRGGYPTMRSKGANDLVNFVLDLEELKGDALAVIDKIISDSIMPYLEHEEGIDQDDLAENGKAEEFDLIRGMIQPGWSIEQLLDEIDRLASGENKDEKGSVAIGTVHKVKGLQRKLVIVNTTRMPITPPKRKEGMLPVGIPNTIQDERNIAYVAVTRAEIGCICMGAQEWMGMPAKTSPFVEELGIIWEKYLEDEDGYESDDTSDDTTEEDLL